MLTYLENADVCHSKGICINKENILSVKPSYEDFINKDNINKIGLSLIGINFYATYVNYTIY